MVSEEVYINSLISSLYKRDPWGILIENFKNYMIDRYYCDGQLQTKIFQITSLIFYVLESIIKTFNFKEKWPFTLICIHTDMKRPAVLQASR